MLYQLFYDYIYGSDAHDPLFVLTMIVTLIHSYFMYRRHFVSSSVTLFTVIADYFCIVALFIYCINNLHMYRTLYQVGMYKTALARV